jgi:hypothetical protein
MILLSSAVDKFPELQRFLFIPSSVLTMFPYSTTEPLFGLLLPDVTTKNGTAYSLHISTGFELLTRGVVFITAQAC